MFPPQKSVLPGCGARGNTNWLKADLTKNKTHPFAGWVRKLAALSAPRRPYTTTDAGLRQVDSHANSIRSVKLGVKRESASVRQ
jgi:hypothetical protein